MPTKDEPVLTVRLPRELNDRLEQLADYHGRSKADEVRLMIAIHDTQATLAALQTDEAKRDLGPAGVAKKQRELKANLRELMKATYRPRPPSVSPLKRPSREAVK